MARSAVNAEPFLPGSQPRPPAVGGLIGRRLGDYELLALLAMGGTSAIYLARIAGVGGFQKYVVVKCLHDHLADDREFVQMFLDEARLGALLAHSNIAQLVSLGEHDGRYYIVMEYVSGLPLTRLARRAGERAAGGRIPSDLCLGIAIQACAGLHHAHDCTRDHRPLNLIHRDVSPPNLVVTFEGVVKVVDFGIAKADQRAVSTQGGQIKGKFAYMAPEQCLAQPIDRRADVFSLGIILHELLTGKRLFKRATPYETYRAIVIDDIPSPSQVTAALDPALDPVVMTALAREPSRRYPTAEAFGEAMMAYLHRRGRAAGAAQIAELIEQCCGAEIEASAQRMRGLMAGSGPAPGWGGAAHRPLVGPALPFVAARTGEALSGRASAQGWQELDGLATEEERDSRGEDTRIELQPEGQLAELDAIAVGHRGPARATAAMGALGPRSSPPPLPRAARGTSRPPPPPVVSAAVVAVAMPHQDPAYVDTATVIVDSGAVAGDLRDALHRPPATRPREATARSPGAYREVWRRWGPWLLLGLVSSVLVFLIGIIAAIHN